MQVFSNLLISICALRGFDKNRGAIFGRRAALTTAVRSEAEDERPSPAASNRTLSAKGMEALATWERLRVTHPGSSPVVVGGLEEIKRI